MEADGAEALRASEERYRALTESSPHGIWHVTLAGQTLYVNPVMCALLEVDGPQALEGKTYHSFFTPEGLAFLSREKGARSHGSGDTYEVELIGERGTRRPVMLSSGPVFGRDGRLESLIGTFVDLTDLRRREAERRRLEEQLEAAERLESLGVLAGGIAHDFNNLLTGVLGNASLAREQLPPSSPVVPILGRIESASTRAAELTTQLLAYAGKGRFHLEAIDLGRLVSEMEPLLRTSVTRKASLHVVPHEGPASICADPMQVRQVVLTLVQNASDALLDGPGDIRIATGAMEASADYLAACSVREGVVPGRFAYVEVSDTGIGMSPETLRRVFEPFFTTKRTGGRGLALAATLGIVRSHQGTIRIDSRPGAGTAFRILFPAIPVAAPSPARNGSASPARNGTASPARPATVLVVDDERAVRDVSTMTLERAGFRVLEACDGAEAVDVLRSRQADIALVVLDMTMPRMDGDEALRALRRLRPGLPVVLCSGYTEQEATAGFGTERPTGFLQKPFRAHDLLEKVQAALLG